MTLPTIEIIPNWQPYLFIFHIAEIIYFLPLHMTESCNYHWKQDKSLKI